MVKRYDSPRQRAKLLKDMPFYLRYIRQLQYVAVILPLACIFGPPIYRFFSPPNTSRIRSVDPRHEENHSKLRKKFRDREKVVGSLSYLEDDK